ncbi:MAG: hypothetical protein ABI383_01975 [Acidobacteriaceae bacterium]
MSFNSSVNAVRLNGGNVVLYAIASNGAVWSASQTGTAGPFSNWTTDYGSFDSGTNPVAVKNVYGYVYLFARGKDGAIWFRPLSSSGQITSVNWRTLYGNIKGITAVLDAAGTVRIFGIGQDGKIWTTRETGYGSQQFATWSSLGL